MVTRAIFVVGLILYSLIVVIADAYLETALGIASVVNAGGGLVVGFGFLVPLTFNIAINPLYPRPIWYELLNATCFLESA